MKRTVLACTISMLLVAVPALAQRGGGPKPAAPHNAQPSGAAAQHGNTATSSMKASGGGAARTASSPKTASAKTTPVKTTSAKATSANPTSAKATSVKTSAKTTSRTTTTSTKTTATSTSSPTTLSPVQQKLQRNTNLAAKLQSRLPGTDLQTAAAGFRNLGQFVAAVNVSNNLGIPFAQLKTRMVDQGMSLGQAIQSARPSTTNPTTVATRAQRDADDLIQRTSSTTTTQTTGTRTTTKTQTAKDHR